MISIKLLKEAGLCFLVGFLLALRYVSIGIDQEQVFFFASYYSLATAVYIFSRIRFNSLINPVSLIVPFLFLLAYSFIQLSIEQVSYTLNTFLIINISIIMYLFFASLSYSYKPVKIIALNNDLKRKFIYFICSMTFLTFVIECFRFGFVPILNMANLDVYGETNSKLVPFLHYFIILNAFIPAWLYIFYKEQIISKKEFIGIFFISVFILLNYLSKQMYLLFGLSFFMAYSFYNNMKLKSIVQSIFFIVAIFFIAGYLRLNSEMTISASEYFRVVAGINNDKVTLLESIFVEYSSKRFSVLDEMVNYKDAINYFGYGTYTFRPFTSFFFLEKIGIIQRIPELDSERRVGTFLIDPYLDYGFLGVFILNSFYGYLASRYYHQFKERHPEAIVKFTIIIFCLLMGMFVNYFNTMLIWLGFILNKLLIGGLKSIKTSL